MANISISDIVSYEMMGCAYNEDLFINYILNRLVPFFNNHPGYILIMDNCFLHHQLDVLRVLNQNNILYNFIPPYFPQLNPLKSFFSELKTKYGAIKPLATRRKHIKSREDDLLTTRNRDFVRYYKRAALLLPKTIARQEFI
ncbi:hypothetical protein CDIK_4313 [Cucumispora dikerogammari]|nr:hypothetical protein CDIK_4313 [Cucumispora dikerogammari]